MRSAKLLHKWPRSTFTVDDDAGQAAQALASPLLRVTQLRQSLLMRRPRP